MITVARGDKILERPKSQAKNNIFIVEHSGYLPEDMQLMTGNQLKHYFLHDNIDNVLDILAESEPELLEIE